MFPRLGKIRDSIQISTFLNLCLLNNDTDREVFIKFISGISVTGTYLGLSEMISRGNQLSDLVDKFLSLWWTVFEIKIEIIGDFWNTVFLSLFHFTMQVLLNNCTSPKWQRHTTVRLKVLTVLSLTMDLVGKGSVHCKVLTLPLSLNISKYRIQVCNSCSTQVSTPAVTLDVVGRVQSVTRGSTLLFYWTWGGGVQSITRWRSVNFAPKWFKQF